MGSEMFGVFTALLRGSAMRKYDEVTSCLMISGVSQPLLTHVDPANADFRNSGCDRIDHTGKTNLTPSTMDLKLPSAGS